MNSLFIISLFFATISCLPIQNQGLKDPISFVDTTEEGAVDKILEMIEQLRSDNAAAMEHANGARDSAQTSNDQTAATLQAATDVEDQALGDAEEGVKDLATFREVARGARAVEADAKGKKQAAQDAADKAANFLAAETERLDEEKATLEEVIELIDTLAASAELQLNGNRNLLSIVDLSSLANADPAAVAEVKALLTDLVATGEAERDTATEADTVAKVDLEAASAVHQTTWNALANALGNVDFQEERNVVLKEEGETAVAAKNNAHTAHENAAQVLSNAEGHLATETARTTSEEATFADVSDLLAKLA